MDETHARAQFLANQKGAVLATGAFEAIFFQKVLRDIFRALHGIMATPRLFQHASANIRTYDLPVFERRMFSQHHGQGIGLFSGGTGCTPHPSRTVAPMGQHPFAKKIKMLGFAEKKRLVGGQQIDCCLEFTRCGVTQ